MGVSALTNWGLNALYNPLYAYSYGMSSYFPTWGAYDYSTWGWRASRPPGSMRTTPTPITRPSRRRPSSSSPCRSQPTPGRRRSPRQQRHMITASRSPCWSPSRAGRRRDAQDALTAARESFRAGDYARTLTLADQALAQTPNDPILHEFRAVVVFALKRYKDGRHGVRRPHGRTRLELGDDGRPLSGRRHL